MKGNFFSLILLVLGGLGIELEYSFRSFSGDILSPCIRYNTTVCSEIWVAKKLRKNYINLFFSCAQDSNPSSSSQAFRKKSEGKK